MADDIRELSKQIVAIFATGDLSNVTFCSWSKIALITKAYPGPRYLDRMDSFEYAVPWWLITPTPCVYRSRESSG